MAIGQRIRGDYQDIPNWQNLRVFEISPVSGDRCVATTGNDQNVFYRVEGTGDLRGEESTCLYRADGTRIRCGTVVTGTGSASVCRSAATVPRPGARGTWPAAAGCG